MGSGISGSYSSGSGSQPYAESYHVVKEMMDGDKQDPYIYDTKTGYFKNPYATTIQDSIVNGQIKMNGNSANGTYTYVLDDNGNIVFARRYNPNNPDSRAPHPTLIGGKDPTVRCAGMIRIESGRICWFDNDSGHFRPNSKSLEQVNSALEALRERYPTIFNKKYSGGQKHA